MSGYGRIHEVALGDVETERLVDRGSAIRCMTDAYLKDLPSGAMADSSLKCNSGT